jgi:uncharacterized protein YkwD
MVAVRRFGHHLAGHEPTLTGRAAAVGYLRHARRWWLGETLAYGSATLATPQALVAELMASPPHRATILDPGARDLGIGLARGGPLPGPGATLTLDLGHAVRR